MPHPRVAERDLSQNEKNARDKLLRYFGGGGDSVVVHHVIERDYRGKTVRDFVALVKQQMDVRELILVGCPLGAPPEHEGGASYREDYETVLASLDKRGWTDADKRAIRKFISEADEVDAPKTRRGRRSGKKE